MKNIANLLAILPLFFAGCSSSQIARDDYYEDNRSTASTVTYQTFYDQLGPYGTWIDYPGHGYVWRPGVGGNFSPYSTNGRWVSTTEGWAWASDYSWGWAPFHYGRWLYDAPYGWLWVPGYEWAPAWVVWGQYNNYYGWAPLAPGININISIGGGWRPPHNYWSFVPNNCINYRNLNGYIVRNSPSIVVNNITIINNSNGGNRRYDRGPAYSEVERYTRSRITPSNIVSARRPGQERIANNRFEVYRPAVANAENRSSGTPRNVRRLDEIRDNNATYGNTNNNRRNRVETDNNNQNTDAGNRPVRRYENRRVFERRQQRNQQVDPSAPTNNEDNRRVFERRQRDQQTNQQASPSAPTNNEDNRRVFERRQRDQQTNQQANPSAPTNNEDNRRVFERRQREQQINQQASPSAPTNNEDNRRVFERRQREQQINQQASPSAPTNNEDNRRVFERRQREQQAQPSQMPQQSNTDQQQMRRSFPSNQPGEAGQQPVRQYRPVEGGENGSSGRFNRNPR